MDALFKKGDKFRCDGYLYHIVLPFEDNGGITMFSLNLK